jgi:uncharacterized membrane protein (UPF0127 family)
MIFRKAAIRGSMQAINVTRGQILANRLAVADTFLSSLIGLMGRGRMAPGEGLWICPCQSVHTLWMRFSIDVLFLDNDKSVIHLVERMKPFRISRHLSRAGSVVELPAATIQLTGTRLGDRLEFVEQ